MKAVIYARYSSHNQREESIEGQLRECQEFAAKNEMTVVDEYIDRAISGKTDNRPSFQKLIKDSEKGHFNAVIMYTLDRFARNRYDSAIYKAKLKKNGVKIFYAKQPMPDTPEGIILESILEGYAEYYSENLSRSIKRGMKENALHGISIGQQPPLGYVIGDDRKYHIDPIGAEIVRKIFQRYAAGQSLTQIANWCNEQGYKTSRGNAFNKNSFNAMLRNDKYIGVYRYMDVVIKDGIPPIIDKDLFDKVQTIRNNNHKTKARTKAKETYFLTTKVFCGHCGSTMIGDSGTSKNGKTHHYYTCSCRKKQHACDKKVVKKKWLEKFAVKYTVETILTEENIDFIATKTIKLIEKDFVDTSTLDSLKTLKKDYEKKIKNIISAIEDGVHTNSTKDRLLELEEHLQEIEKQITQENMKKPLLTKEHIVYWLTSFKSGDINNEDYTQRIIDTLLNSLYIYDLPEGGQKLIFTFNSSAQNSSTIECSDITLYAPPNNHHPNTFFFTKGVFGLVAIIEEV